MASRAATASRACSVPKRVPEEADQRRAAKEGAVADGGDHADPGGRIRRVVGGGAHADREAQGRRRRPRGPPRRTPSGLPPKTNNSQADQRDTREHPDDDDAAEPVEQAAGRTSGPAVIAVRNIPKPSVPTAAEVP